MAKTEQNGRSTGKPRQSSVAATKVRIAASKAHHQTKANAAGASRAGWATDLVFDVREPKLAVSLRLDADVLRFFRGFGAGYQTRINEVLKAFMHAREDVEIGARMVAGAKASQALPAAKRVR
jgi:uncharacterized protein (DUF4415 family)